MLQGRCLCGDVAWEGEGPLELPHHCHCSICRRSHGAAFASMGGLAAATFRLHADPAQLLVYATSDHSRRRFCARCGSPAPLDPLDGQVFVPLGQLGSDPDVRPVAHIYVGSKAPWYEIADALPQFDTLPPGFDVPALPDRPPLAPQPGVVRGSCQCAAVAYEIAGPVRRFYHCHCSRCRRARGAAHASNLFVAAEDLRWTRGADLVTTWTLPDAARFAQSFCRVCGGKVPRVNSALGYAAVPAGSLDDPPGAAPEAHIFVGSKAPWFEIADALPQFETAPPPS